MGKRGNGEGSIYEVAGKGWRGCVSLGYKNGKPARKYVTGKTRGEVAKKINALVNKLERHEVISTGRRTVARYMEEWLRIQIAPNRSPSTFGSYERHNRLYITPKLGRLQLEELDAKDVQAFLNELAEADLDPASVISVNKTLKSALSCAVRWRYIERNAAKLVTLPQSKKFHAKTLPAPEAEKLLAVLHNHALEALFWVALMMGLRRGEVLALRWADVDFLHGRLHIRQSLQRISKRIREATKREGGPSMQLVNVKSHRSDRQPPIPPLVLDALQRRKAIQEMERIRAGQTWKGKEEFIFTAEDGGHLSVEEPYRLLQEKLSEAGLPQIRFHDLRHSTASLLVRKGTPLKVVQEILGHSTFQITADLYSHLEDSDLKDAMDSMNSIFSQRVAAPVAAPARKELLQ